MSEVSKVHFGASMGRKPGVYPGIQEVGPDNYIKALLEDGGMGSPGDIYGQGETNGQAATNGHVAKKSGNRLVQLAVAGIAGTVAWKMGAGKFIQSKFSALPSWLTGIPGKLSNLFKKTPAQTP